MSADHGTRARQRPTHAGTARASGAPRVPFALLVAGLIIGGMALLVALNTASAANELQRHTLSDRDAVVAASIEQLRNEIAASAAPANLAAAARRMGMVPDDHPAFIVIGRHGSVRVLGKPGAVAGPVVPVPTTPPAPPKQSQPDQATTSTTASSTTSAPTTATTSTSAQGATPHGRHHTARPSAQRSPSGPSPTPTVTLPGGAR